MDVLEGIQDMGAAGLTSSSVEMAGRAGNGIELNLDLVPRRAKGMTPYEILLSESQERMLLVTKPGKEQEVLAVCKRWELDAAVIGVVTDTKRWVIKATPGYDPLVHPKEKANPVVAADIPIDILTDGAPVYDRPRAAILRSNGAAATSGAPPTKDPRGDLLALLGSPNVGSRRWVWRQYDHIVRGGTVVRPGSDAGVVRVPCEKDGKVVEKHLAFASDCNGRMVELDAFRGAAMAVAEVCRNLVCSGAEPIGITDCLNFGNPERPEVMESFAVAVDGLAAACKALEVPIVSGNVSLYNETDGRAILPTPTVAAVGLVAKPADIVTQWFRRAGDVVAMLGPSSTAIDGSEYAVSKTGKLAGRCPDIDLALEARLQKLVLELAREGALASAHDVGDGGLAVALAECCTTSPADSPDVGARIEVECGAHTRDPLDATARLFGESPSRVVVSVAREKLDHVAAMAKAADVPFEELGVTGGDSLSIALVDKDGDVSTDGTIRLALREIREKRERCLEAVVGS
jgi:phosphoribosylformylglycinamidine synthase